MGRRNTLRHRRALIPIDGKVRIAQRFAIDWVQLRPNGETFTGDPKDNKNYRAYGTEVLAVADGTVAATKDGIPQNIPGVDSRAVPITLETVGGNHIILDLGRGFFAFYAHLQPGSLRVKVRRSRTAAARCWACSATPATPPSLTCISTYRTQIPRSAPKACRTCWTPSKS